MAEVKFWIKGQKSGKFTSFDTFDQAAAEAHKLANKSKEEVVIEKHTITVISENVGKVYPTEPTIF